VKEKDGLNMYNEALYDLYPHKMLCGQINEEEGSGACDMHSGEEKCIQDFGVET
jgi:hypothetical protein